MASPELWCEARKGKKLYELQIETCELAIPKVKEVYPGMPEAKRDKAIEEIRASIKKLKETKRAVRPERLYFYG
jgi:hypothetical protein